MPIENSTMALGATNSTTGGTDFVLSADGVVVLNGKHLINAAVADMRVRPNVTIRTKMAKVQPSGEWSKGRRSGTYCRPKLLASGKMTFPLVRCEIEDHPEMTAEEVLELSVVGAQMFINAAWTNFWATGATS